jgi:hypothetical protein
MAWEIGPYFLEAGRTMRIWFSWGGSYKGIQVVQARPERHGTGTPIFVIGGRVELVVNNAAMEFDPESQAYAYLVDVHARDGDWYQFRLRGHRVD